MNETERPPLKPADTTHGLVPWKTDTALRQYLFAMSEFVPVLLTIERALKTDNPGILCGFTYMKYVDLTPKDDAHARRIVGKLIRAFKAQPEIRKPTDDTMESVWRVDGVIVTVKGYLQKTCRYEEVEVELPAEPERIETVIHEAKPARKEKRRVIVCDDKDEPQVPQEVAAAVANGEGKRG